METKITAEAHADAVAAAFDRGVTVCHAAIIARINNRILAARDGADDIADRLVTLKRELPTVEQILAERGGP